jgi:hypothetical protein
MENYNYKVTYSYTIENTGFLESSNKKLKKTAINLAFENEPSDYEIESRVKDWVRDLQDQMEEIDCEIEFEEIIKIKKLKVTKGLSDI